MRKHLFALFVVLFGLQSTVYATQVVALANGNFMTAGTWGTVDAAGTLWTTSTASTALTTGNLDSATFVLGASQVGSFAIHVASRAAGSPSNTMTVILRNSTTATNTCSVTVNVSDIQVSATADFSGSWYLFKCASTFTPNGTDSYLIRATLSATSTAVSLHTNGTANNWARFVVRTATASPVAGDDILILKYFDGAANPATSTAVTVTMDSTTNTDYGSNASNSYTPAMFIGAGATLTWGTAASTNYLLRLSGWLYNQGTYNMGTSGTPIPSTSTAQLEFDEDSDGKFGFMGQDNAIINIYGVPRTAGKLVTWTKLTADLAAAGTTLNVAADTGWLNGDTIVISPTSRTSTQDDPLTLNANAGASSMTTSAGAAFAHGGTAPVIGEVILRTRNVIITSTSTTNLWGMFFHASSPTVNVQWAEFKDCGGVTTTVMRCVAGDDVRGGTLTFKYDHFDWRSRTAAAFSMGTSSQASTATWVYDNNTAYWVANVASALTAFMGTAGNTAANITITNSVIVGGVTTGTGVVASGITLRQPSTSGFLTVHDLYVSGWGNTNEGAISLADTWNGNSATVTDIHDIYVHSNAGHNVYNVLAGVFFNTSRFTFRNWTAYRCADSSIRLEQANQITFDNLLSFGNTIADIDIESGGSFYIKNSTLAGDTSFATTEGILIAAGSSAFQTRATYEMTNWLIDNTLIGPTSGIYVPHTAESIRINGVTGPVQITARNSLFGSTTEILNFTDANNIPTPFFHSFFASERHDQINGNHFTQYIHGRISQDTTTTHVSGFSEKLAPTSATAALKLESGIRQYSVLNGNTVTVSVWVRKDGAYGGAAPRLILKANPALGVNSDTVIDTLSVGANDWELLTGTTPTAIDNGVFQFVIDCDGTTGNVYDAEWQ